MKIRSLRQIKNFSNKIIFLRVDFNVPLEKGKIKDDYKITAGVESLQFLITKGAKIIVATHLGEPTKIDSAYSVLPVAKRLQQILKNPVKFVSEVSGEKVKLAASKMKRGDVLMLENLRFNQGEYSDDLKFAAELASLADIYVNDAFAVCHRKQSSVSGIKKYLPAYAGCLLEKELRAMDKILKPKKPLVVIMGGAKIKTKAPLIARLYPLASQILLGGALANNFFKFQKIEIGKSLIDSDSLGEVNKFFKRGRLDSKIVLPIDLVVKTRQGKAKVVSVNEVNVSDSILDIGPSTIASYAEYIKKAKTLVWNGPLGKFEEVSFKNGTLMVGRFLASRSSGYAYGVVGGGETVEALKLTKMAEHVDWVSTAGGAMLTYLGGASMPGLSGIVK